jgi:hypothetical protein
VGSNENNGAVQRPFNHPGPGPDIREEREEAAPPPPCGNGVVAARESESAERGPEDPKGEARPIVVSRYLAQQIKDRNKRLR